MGNAMDFSPYRRSTVGFDRLFDFLERQAQSESLDTYPPFDLQKVADDRYQISLAVAGFRQDEIDITAHQNLLTIAGRKEQGRNQDGSYLHVGIAARPFERRFELADFMRVETAELRDGLLSIELVREVPEAMKPHTIPINGGSTETVEIGDGRPGRQRAEERAMQDA